MESSSPKTYDQGPDWMRLFAAYFVVLIHASGACAGSTVYNTLSRFSVPVFVVVSGYYMLDRETSFKTLFLRIGRLFVEMVAVSGLFWCYERFAGRGRPLSDLPRYLLTEPVHLWYVYALMGLYLFTPVMRTLYLGLTKRDYLYTLGLCFLFGSVVTLLLRTGRTPLLTAVMDKTKIAALLGFPFLYLTGGYIRRFGVSDRAFAVLCTASAVLTVGAVWVMLRPEWADASAEGPLSFFAPNAMLGGVSFFLLVRRLSEAHPLRNPRAKAALREAAACTAGVYYLHPLFIQLRLDRGWTFPSLGLLEGPLAAGAAFLAAFLVTFALRTAVKKTKKLLKKRV